MDMVCIYCASDTAVTNSRLQKRSNQVWRRRSCVVCGATFTTHESIDLSGTFSVENKGVQLPFLADKLFREILDSLRGHDKPYEAARELTSLITRNLTLKAPKGLILAHDISAESAKVLKRFDKQAYLRYAAEHPSVQQRTTFR